MVSKITKQAKGVSKSKVQESLLEQAKTKMNYKHGLAGTRFYYAYRNMRNRCEYERSTSFAFYGAKGITVCKEWKKIEAFAFDMLQSYKKHVKKFGEKNTQLDRIDNSKGYSKSNCRWTTTAAQARNKSNNTWVTIRGETLCVTDWCRKRSISWATIKQRMKNGMSPKEAITQPIKQYAKNKNKKK